MSVFSKFFYAAVLMANISCSVFGWRGEETPMYEIVKKTETMEIRHYQPQIIAKTTVDSSYDEAQRKAFRILANYIFGDNQSRESLAMTAPVTQSAKKNSVAIPMTAPVSQLKSQKGWTVSFMMPSKYQMADLPIPSDSRVVFEQLSSRHMAAITYSWGRGEERNAQKGKELLAWVERLPGYEATPPLISAGYDPPWTLPFLRRNEVLIQVNSL